jgi:purine-binding chemotaxis protein CheW
LQQPLSVAPDKFLFVNMHDFSPLLMLVFLFGIVVLVIMSLRLRAARVSTERPVEIESSERVRFKRNMVETLSRLCRAMENLSKTLLATGQRITAAMAQLFPSGEPNKKGNKGSITTENVVGGVETAPQVNLMPLGSPTKTSCTNNSEEKFTQIVTRMRELVELSQRLQSAARTFDRNSTTPLLKMENADSTAQTRRYLPFFLGNELFAISIRNVKEIVEARLIIESDRPWRTRRAINLRGSVVPVIDLSVHVGAESTQVNQSTLIVILELIHDEHPQMIGVMVDALCKILYIAPSSIETPLVQQANIRSSLTIGILRTDNRSITLLDISRGLSMGIFHRPNSISRALE